MTINIIAYPPGGGGNHLRNLCDLDGRFQEQWPWAWVREQRVGLAPYDSPQGMPGEVHSLPGRNIHEVFVERVTAQPAADYILQGHFGELAPHAAAIRSWPDTRWLLVTMDSEQDRCLLRQRQHRLQYHPYWLDEEQIFLYRTEMYTHFFAARPDRVHGVSVEQLWQRDVTASGVLEAVAQAFDIAVDATAAQVLHHKWCDLNFGPAQDRPAT
jgi:hypothetical protein